MAGELTPFFLGAATQSRVHAVAVRNFLHNALLCFTTILLVLSIAEASVRVYHGLKRNTSFWTTFVGPDRTDAFLGWTPKEFYFSSKNTVDYFGNHYRIEYKTYQYGFREWSNVGIAVITEAPEALRAAEAHGVQIRALDGTHWNEKGHEIAGVALAKGLSRVLERE